MRFLTSAAVCLVVAACSSHHTAADAPDAKLDALSFDSAFEMARHDGGHDAARDAKVGPDTACSRCDAGHDAGRDASHDAQHDAGHDAGHDSGTSHDAGQDVAPKGAHTTNVPISVTTSGGVQMRSYDITVPTGCDAAHPLPLVFAFHGDGGKGADMYAGFPIEQAAAAAGGKAIFVYPDGLDNNIDPSGATRAWNLYEDPGAYPYAVVAPSGNNDIDFFDAMVASFETNYCVDPSRIFITGMSSGGYLSNQFARWRSGVVKGTAPQSGGMPFGNPNGSGDWQPPNYCVGTTGKVPTLIIHGLSDGTVDPCNAIEAQSYWELANGCSGSANNCTGTSDTCTGAGITIPPPDSTTPSTLNADCVAAAGCGSNAVVLCEVPGMGHSIWSEAPSVIWTFFAGL